MDSAANPDGMVSQPAAAWRPAATSDRTRSSRMGFLRFDSVAPIATVGSAGAIDPA
jgi:hypothetical protein